MKAAWIPAVLLLSTSLAPAQAPPQATELASRIQARYDGVRSFTADFTQTYAGGLLGLTTTESGDIKLKKPGRFRMEYTEPEKKTFVAALRYAANSWEDGRHWSAKRWRRHWSF